MNTMKYLQIYGGTAGVMLVLDMLWLGFIAKAWYQQGIGHLMASQPNLATLRDWPLKLSIMDVVWGSLVSGLAAGAGKAVQIHVGHV